MIESIAEVMTIKTVLGLAGAVPGGWRAYVFSRAHNGRARAVSDALIGIVFAASVIEIFTPKDYPSAAILIGLIAALVGGKALDAVFELVPEVVRVLALGWANKVAGGAGEKRLRSSTGWGELETPQRVDKAGDDDAG